MSDVLVSLLGDAVRHIDLSRPHDSVEQLSRLTRLLGQTRDFIADMYLEESSERTSASFDPQTAIRLWQTLEQVQKLALAQCFFHGTTPSKIERLAEPLMLQK
ncbi:MAG: hypothetical protein FWD62_10255 [Betaproteobacteria bacterium]|nr:hypothetical protein [Betaproteobacteria bacterium]